MSKERFLLEVEVLPQAVPGIARLRSMLKWMLRAFRIRCVSIRPLPDPPNRKS